MLFSLIYIWDYSIVFFQVQSFKLRVLIYNFIISVRKLYLPIVCRLVLVSLMVCLFLYIKTTNIELLYLVNFASPNPGHKLIHLSQHELLHILRAKTFGELDGELPRHLPLGAIREEHTWKQRTRIN